MQARANTFVGIKMLWIFKSRFLLFFHKFKFVIIFFTLNTMRQNPVLPQIQIILICLLNFQNIL